MPEFRAGGRLTQRQALVLNMQKSMGRLEKATREVQRLQNKEAALLRAENERLRAALRPLAAKAYCSNGCPHYECGLRRKAKEVLDE